ncbi:MAG: hypothetical protein F6K28_08395 [Microcoleus sp. SIO2G3]|nr:hypothetical protein [Microcoleus sp. SIO2G3]
MHNLANQACTVTLELEEGDGERLIDLLGDQPYEAIDGTSHDIQLEGYGYRWFRVGCQHL